MDKLDIVKFNGTPYEVDAPSRYKKPSTGIPKSDLASAVQTSLGKADSAIQSHQSLAEYRKAADQDAIDANKVDKVSGKGLSTNDYTTAEKNKLAGIATGAEVNVQSDWNATSGDAFIKNKPTIPTKTSDLINDSGFVTNVVPGEMDKEYIDAELAKKQDVIEDLEQIREGAGLWTKNGDKGASFSIIGIQVYSTITKIDNTTYKLVEESNAKGYYQKGMIALSINPELVLSTDDDIRVPVVSSSLGSDNKSLVVVIEQGYTIDTTKTYKILYKSVDDSISLGHGLASARSSSSVNTGLATNIGAFAENTSMATGEQSHAEGIYTIASGRSSHAEGSGSEASGESSHAEGVNTKATSMRSHAEGSGTTASGQISHAEGNTTNAIGNGSHAEGNKSNAKGNFSHAEGYVTTTENEGEHAEGYYNLSHKTSSTNGDGGNTLHSVGLGWNKVPKNAYEVMQNGDFYMLGVGGYDGTNSTSADSKTIQTLIDGKADKEELTALAQGFSDNLGAFYTKSETLSSAQIQENIVTPLGQLLGGGPDDLSTTAKTLVGAINEVNAKGGSGGGSSDPFVPSVMCNFNDGDTIYLEAGKMIMAMPSSMNAMSVTVDATNLINNDSNGNTQSLGCAELFIMFAKPMSIEFENIKWANNKPPVWDDSWTSQFVMLDVNVLGSFGIWQIYDLNT